MKTEFVECRWSGKARLSKEQLERLPQKIALCSTVQFLGLLPEIKEQLTKKGKKVVLIRANNTPHPGQVLGCSKFKVKGVDSILFIGDGMFHPINAKLVFAGTVFAFNPISKKMAVIDDVAVTLHKGRVNGMYNTFLGADTVGVLISTKPGQAWKEFSRLEHKYKKKQFYYFLFDEINLQQLDNFPFIQIFLNTACPRIGIEDAFAERKPVLNIDAVL
jgi:2-(3-amino-3-carboxypropyl)histidine synthase